MRTLSHVQRDLIERVLAEIDHQASRTPIMSSGHKDPIIVRVDLSLPEALELKPLLKYIRESRRAPKSPADQFYRECTEGPARMDKSMQSVSAIPRDIDGLMTR